MYDFEAADISGASVALSSFREQVVLVVNTASACGFTPQFAALESLWQTYRDRGLVVLGFPSNEFGEQDPGTNAEISDFCQLNYGVTFPMMGKVTVNGDDAHPLFRWLKTQAPGLLGTEAIKWNFTKFLVARDGTVLKRYGPTTTPESMVADIEAALEAGSAVT